MLQAAARDPEVQWPCLVISLTEPWPDDLPGASPPSSGLCLVSVSICLVFGMPGSSHGLLSCLSVLPDVKQSAGTGAQGKQGYGRVMARRLMGRAECPAQPGTTLLPHVTAGLCG